MIVLQIISENVDICDPMNSDYDGEYNLNLTGSSGQMVTYFPFRFYRIVTEYNTY